MSRARSRKAKRAFDALGWADQRRITNARESAAYRKANTPKPKPQWVADIESSGYQTVGGTRRSSRVSGLTREQRQQSKAVRKARPASYGNVRMTEYGTRRKVGTKTGRVVKVETVKRTRVADPRKRVLEANVKPRQTRADGREALMSGTSVKLLKLPVGTVLRASLLPEYHKPKTSPSVYTR